MQIRVAFSRSLRRISIRIKGIMRILFRTTLTYKKMEIQTSNDKNLPKLETLKEIPEEMLWLANFNSDCSIQTYRLAVRQFMLFFGIETPEQLREISHSHIIAFKRHLQETERSPRTINNRLSALSSLFDHLIVHQIVKINPVQAVRRMRINTDRVEAKALSTEEVRSMLDLPDIDRLQGLRDRAILGILFFTGCRVGELCKLKVGDYYEEQGFRIVDFQIKGGKRNRLAVNQELQIFLNEYLCAAGHENSGDFPLILPILKSRALSVIRHITSRQIQKLWKKYAERCGIEGTAPHSARTTFITNALENKCPIEATQKSVGHSQIKTTQMYDKRTFKYRESASFAVRY